MTEPKRLLAPDAEGTTAFERHLLEGVLDEQPSAAMTQRMLETTLAAGHAAAPGGSATVSLGGWFAGAAGALGAAGLAAAIWLGARPAEPETGAAPSVVSPAHEAQEEAREPVWSGAREPASEVVGEPASEAAEPGASTQTPAQQTGASTQQAGAYAAQSPRKAAPAANERGPSTTSMAEPEPASLREEIELLERARAQLREGDSSAALATLATYDARFPSGTLRRESALLRQRLRTQRAGSATDAGAR